MSMSFEEEITNPRLKAGGKMSSPPLVAGTDDYMESSDPAAPADLLKSIDSMVEDGSLHCEVKVTKTFLIYASSVIRSMSADINAAEQGKKDAISRVDKFEAKVVRLEAEIRTDKIAVDKLIQERDVFKVESERFYLEKCKANDRIQELEIEVQNLQREAGDHAIDLSTVRDQRDHFSAVCDEKCKAEERVRELEEAEGRKITFSDAAFMPSHAFQSQCNFIIHDLKAVIKSPRPHYRADAVVQRICDTIEIGRQVDLKGAVLQSEFQNSLDVMEKEKNKATGRIKELEAEVAKLKEEATKHNDRFATVAVARDILFEEKLKATNDLFAMTSDRDFYKKQSESLACEVCSAEKRIQELEGKVIKLTQETNSHIAAYSKVAADRDNFSNQKMHAEDRVEELEDRVAQLKLEAENKEVAVEKLSQERDNLKAETERFADEKNKADNLLKDEAAKSCRCEQFALILSERLVTSLETNASLQRAVDTLQQKLQANEHSAENEKHEAENYVKDAADAAQLDRITELEKELKCTASDRDCYKRYSNENYEAWSKVYSEKLKAEKRIEELEDREELKHEKHKKNLSDVRDLLQQAVDELKIAVKDKTDLMETVKILQDNTKRLETRIKDLENQVAQGSTAIGTWTDAYHTAVQEFKAYRKRCNTNCNPCSTNEINVASNANWTREAVKVSMYVEHEDGWIEDTSTSTSTTTTDVEQQVRNALAS